MSGTVWFFPKKQEMRPVDTLPLGSVLVENGNPCADPLKCARAYNKTLVDLYVIYHVFISCDLQTKSSGGRGPQISDSTSLKC